MIIKPSEIEELREYVRSLYKNTTMTDRQMAMFMELIASYEKWYEHQHRTGVAGYELPKL